MDLEHSDLYKNRWRLSTIGQDERISAFLQQQKLCRHNVLDSKRSITDLFNKPNRPTNKEQYFKWMQSECVLEPPSDLATNWLCKMCPKGTRYLLVAEKGMTTCYRKSTQPRRGSYRFKTPLPGGGTSEPFNTFTVLDCVYSAKLKTYYVFDVLAWNSLSLVDSEAQFRFYWLRSKFREMPELQQNSFVLIDSVEMTDIDMNYELDGVLFYHKEGFYTTGKTPLVRWLKTCRVPEVLGINGNGLN